MRHDWIYIKNRGKNKISKYAEYMDVPLKKDGPKKGTYGCEDRNRSAIEMLASTNPKSVTPG